MKNTTKWIIAAVLSGMLAATGVVMAAAAPAPAPAPYGSTGALNDTEYTLEEMLTYAIEDEYAAQAEYEAIMNTFGTVRPYTNIITAEQQHISELLPLFETYGLAVPENGAASLVIVPGTLAETYAIGVEAEEKNIAMYDLFLKEDLPDDVRIVFENLKSASEKHLASFERNAERAPGTVSGQQYGSR